MKTITKNVKFAQLTLNNNKMETRETSKEKIFKKIIGEPWLLQTNTIYGKQYHTCKPQYPIMVKNELGIFTQQSNLLQLSSSL